jgi:hypothetical protein
MNERINELMKQSMVEYQFDLRFSPEKFAELILKECLSYMNDANGDIDYVKFLIKRNFGVEK